MTTTPKIPGNKPRIPTMQVICLTTTDGISHEFFGPSLLRSNQPANLQSVDFGPELTLQEVQEILKSHAEQTHNHLN